MIESIQIQIENKTHRNGLCTIKDLNFSTSAGEFIAIVGPSGAGKTTLLNVISGLDEDIQGEVLVNNRLPLSGLAHHRGFVFQEPRLMPWLTVQKNIELVLDNNPEKIRAVPKILQEVGLDGFGHLYPGQLSGGMQRRVGLARAFIVEPSLLLLDEPFQSLDEPTANDLRALLLRLWNKRRPSVFFVTHQLREAMTLADRIVFVSARPARVVLDYQVEIERPRIIDGEAVSQACTALLNEFPKLLSGERQ
ncbi:MAG: ABC transporter ATP-binding protein [Acidiferrobacterales bacterium]|nr:ABC transporter ATP-binding protein [Acidiferrobacterales bacterium]